MNQDSMKSVEEPLLLHLCKQYFLRNSICFDTQNNVSDSFSLLSLPAGLILQKKKNEQETFFRVKCAARFLYLIHLEAHLSVFVDPEGGSIIWQGCLDKRFIIGQIIIFLQWNRCWCNERHRSLICFFQEEEDFYDNIAWYKGIEWCSYSFSAPNTWLPHPYSSFSPLNPTHHLLILCEALSTPSSMIYGET